MSGKLRHDRGVPYLRRLAAALGLLLVVAGCTSSSPDHPPTERVAAAFDEAEHRPGPRPRPVPRPDPVHAARRRSGALGDDVHPLRGDRHEPHADLHRPLLAQRAARTTPRSRSPFSTPATARRSWASTSPATGRAGRPRRVGTSGTSRLAPPAGSTTTWTRTGRPQHYGHSAADYLLDVLAAKAGEFIAVGGAGREAVRAGRRPARTRPGPRPGAAPRTTPSPAWARRTARPSAGCRATRRPGWPRRRR